MENYEEDYQAYLEWQETVGNVEPKHTWMDWVARQGRLELLKRMHCDSDHECTLWAMDLAASNGQLEVVKWLHEHRTEGCTSDAMDWAAKGGHLEVILWLQEHRTEGCTSRAIDYAASAGHLHVIKWLHQHRTEGCTQRAMDCAYRCRHEEVVKWLHLNRPKGCTNVLPYVFFPSNWIDDFKFRRAVRIVRHHRRRTAAMVIQRAFRAWYYRPGIGAGFQRAKQHFIECL